ncbi:MAG TPA: SCP2 sterol-binding domain-containing protein [Methylomirabilota bacterium]|nr:SCP2 sterol-binding domain-containing protein [Methylomirabilota bacterium]
MSTVKESFERMPARFRPEQASSTDLVVQYDISGEGGGTWHAVIANGTCAVNDGPAPNPTLTLRLSAADWLDMASGKRSGQALYLMGRLKVTGNLGLATKLGAMFAT